MRSSILAAIAALAACASPEERKATRAAVERTAVSAESARAAVTAVMPATDRWDEPHLVERLVRAGLAPQAMPEATGEKYWGVPVLVYRVGASTLHAYIYADSAARSRVTRTLDSLSAAPPGVASPYAPPRTLVVENNLAAVVVGGSDRQQERVALAIGAGVPLAK